MTRKATPSGLSLSSHDAAIAKAMLNRGDRQHDVAAWFGVNGGRIAEISSGAKFGDVRPASELSLPPPGPYLPGKEVAVLLQAFSAARSALDDAELLLRRRD